MGNNGEIVVLVVMINDDDGSEGERTWVVAVIRVFVGCKNHESRDDIQLILIGKVIILKSYHRHFSTILH